MRSVLKDNNPQSAIRNPQSKMFYWLPPLLWMVAIFIFSTDNFSGEKTGGLLYQLFHAIIPSLTEEQFKPWHFLLRKAAHFTEYAVLALLLFRAFRFGAIERWRWRWGLYSILTVIVYALFDEYHQTRTSHRVGSIYDSLIDTSGGVAAMIFLWFIRRTAANK